MSESTDLVAGFPVCDTLANRDNFSRNLQSHNGRGIFRWWVVASALQQIGTINPGGAHLDKYFTESWVGCSVCLNTEALIDRVDCHIVAFGGNTFFLGHRRAIHCVVGEGQSSTMERRRALSLFRGI